MAQWKRGSVEWHRAARRRSARRVLERAFWGLVAMSLFLVVMWAVAAHY